MRQLPSPFVTLSQGQRSKMCMFMQLVLKVPIGVYIWILYTCRHDVHPRNEYYRSLLYQDLELTRFLEPINSTLTCTVRSHLRFLCIQPHEQYYICVLSAHIKRGIFVCAAYCPEPVFKNSALFKLWDNHSTGDKYFHASTMKLGSLVSTTERGQDSEEEKEKRLLAGDKSKTPSPVGLEPTAFRLEV